MTKVSFYLIENKPLRQADLACRLCQQIVDKHRIWLYCTDQQQCDELNTLLWNYEPTSFLPHAIDQISQPICLSTQLPNPSFDVCLNLTQKAINPQQLMNPNIHLIEIVENNEQKKQLSREIFKQYRQFGLDPVIHRI